MTDVAIELQGTLREDGTLVLDSSPNLPPGRVRVVVEKLEELDNSASNGVPELDYLNRVLAEAEARDAGRSLPERTDAEWESLRAASIWFLDQLCTDLLVPYQGQYIAILAEKILDADSDKAALIRRIETQCDSQQNRILIKYVYRAEDWNF